MIGVVMTMMKIMMVMMRRPPPPKRMSFLGNFERGVGWSFAVPESYVALCQTSWYPKSGDAIIIHSSSHSILPIGRYNSNSQLLQKD